MVFVIVCYGKLVDEYQQVDVRLCSGIASGLTTIEMGVDEHGHRTECPADGLCNFSASHKINISLLILMII